ncbi:MAG: beta-lactamase family protein [Saprospiraceae bacterium]|nr:beta-lactamase family protein [Saprospiraceae bacterium]
MQLHIISIFLVLVIPTFGQKTTYQKLDKIVSNYEKKNLLMGSIAFSQNGNLVYAKAVAYANIDKQIKADTGTKYRIGSVSKLFTATMIMQLVAEGKLALEDSIARFFPQWPNAQEITIEHLLRHQSGIFNFGKSKNRKYKHANPQTIAEIISLFETAQVAFPPGKKVDYNNANYVVLSLIIEVLDQTSFAIALENRITKPLKLQDTHAGGPIDVSKKEAMSYSWEKRWSNNGDFYNPSLLGAGALVSTPADVNSFLQGLFNHSILPEAQLNQMLQTEEGMGLGIFTFPFYDKTAYGHSGNIDAFESLSIYFPSEKTSFSICLNANRVDFNEVLIALLSSFFNR